MDREICSQTERQTDKQRETDRQLDKGGDARKRKIS